MRTFVIGVLAMVLFATGGWLALDRLGEPATEVSEDLGSVRLHDPAR